MKILLVEDHAALGPITRSLLQAKFQHEVQLVASGEEALEAADQLRPDLVLTDLNLPDIDGYELTRRLRQRPAFADTIIVAISGLGNFIDAARAKDADIDACFTKPMDFSLLTSVKRRGE